MAGAGRVHVGAADLAAHGVRDLLLADFRHHAGHRVRNLLDAGFLDHAGAGAGNLLDDRAGHLLVDALLHVGRAGHGLADRVFLPDLAAAHLVGALRPVDAPVAAAVVGLASARVEAAGVAGPAAVAAALRGAGI